jgi:hypothetical protein
MENFVRSQGIMWRRVGQTSQMSRSKHAEATC